MGNMPFMPSGKMKPLTRNGLIVLAVAIVAVLMVWFLGCSGPDTPEGSDLRSPRDTPEQELEDTLADASLVAEAVATSESYRKWPGSDYSFEAIANRVSVVVIATARENAIVTDRHSYDISTVMGMGDGEVIRGGGYVTSVRCRQRFEVTNILYGKFPRGDCLLNYGFVEKSDAFPGPREQIAIPNDAKVILFLVAEKRIIKALRATPANLETVRKVIPHLGVKSNDSSPAWSPDGKKIAFTSKRDGNAEIYVMNADGSEQKRLTNNPAHDGYPSWSPDGKKIAFFSKRDGNDKIYVMNADGSNQKRLTIDPAYYDRLSWSPDGKKIAFTSERDGNLEIYVMKADGGGEKNLTNNPATDRFPVWSPDGKKIAYHSHRHENLEIYIMNPDGTEQKRLTDNPAGNSTPTWSPDGQKIAFQSLRSYEGMREIYVMNADGGGEKNLTNNPATDRFPVWSPDGKKIAFNSHRDGNLEIYVMNTNGGEQKNLTNNPATDQFPVWSPDGKKIAFTSKRDINQEIYVMNADGTEQKNLTNNPAKDVLPSWSPFLSSEEE